MEMKRTYVIHLHDDDVEERKMKIHTIRMFVSDYDIDVGTRKALYDDETSVSWFQFRCTDEVFEELRFQLDLVQVWA